MAEGPDGFFVRFLGRQDLLLVTLVEERVVLLLFFYVVTWDG